MTAKSGYRCPCSRVPPGPGRGGQCRAVVYGPRQPQRQETQVVEGGKKREEKNKTGRRWIAHCVGWPRVVYCVGKFGGMFKQRNELVDKHHYGYLASTLDATTRICLPTSCTGSWTNIFGPTTRCRTRRGLGLWFAARCQFQFQFQPRLRSILPDNLMPSLCGRLV